MIFFAVRQFLITIVRCIESFALGVTLKVSEAVVPSVFTIGDIQTVAFSIGIGHHTGNIIWSLHRKAFISKVFCPICMPNPINTSSVYKAIIRGNVIDKRNWRQYLVHIETVIIVIALSR